MSWVEKITKALHDVRQDILLASLEEKSLLQTQWAKVYSSVEAALLVFLCLGGEEE